MKIRISNDQFIAYKFAKVSEGERIEVVYYVLNPITKKLARKRISSMAYKTKRENIRHAHKIANAVNRKLEEGWNPFLEGESQIKLISIEKAMEKALLLKKAIVEKKTFDTYESRVNIFLFWLRENNWNNKIAIEITPEIAQLFCDYLIIDKEVSARTHNNYVNDFVGFFNVLKKRNFIATNPFSEISTLQTTEKIKEHLSDKEFELLKNELPSKSIGFQICCKLTYYCAIRNNEISKLKIKNFNLEEGYITIDGSSSKVKRVRTVPIIDQGFLTDLKNYVKNIDTEYYIVSKNFIPGAERDSRLTNKLSDQFRNMAKKLKFRKGVSYYALKDTLAAQLIKEKVNIKVIQLLMGHSNISMTENYLTKYKPDLSEHIIGKIKLLS